MDGGLTMDSACFWCFAGIITERVSFQLLFFALLSWDYHFPTTCWSFPTSTRGGVLIKFDPATRVVLPFCYLLISNSCLWLSLSAKLTMINEFKVIEFLAHSCAVRREDRFKVKINPESWQHWLVTSFLAAMCMHQTNKDAGHSLLLLSFPSLCTRQRLTRRYEMLFSPGTFHTIAHAPINLGSDAVWVTCVCVCVLPRACKYRKYRVMFVLYSNVPSHRRFLRNAPLNHQKQKRKEPS